MGKTGLQKCEMIWLKLRELKIDEVNLGILRRIIKIIVGTDERTIKQYIELLLEFKFIKYKDYDKYEVNKEKPI